MTTRRIDLLCGMVTFMTAGVMFGVGQVLLGLLIFAIAAGTLRPLWRLSGRHAVMSVTVVETAEGDEQAQGARRAARTNGGLRAPQKGSDSRD